MKIYLREINADDGETLHGFRSGCSITLALSGVELSEIMDHVGWSRRHTALYYMQLAKVLNPSRASAKLASNVTVDSSQALKDINELKQFVSAFPPENIHKRPRIEKLELVRTSS